MDKIQATGNRNKVLTGGMIDVAQDGSVLQGVYAPAVLVRDEAERDALPADYPPGTIAFTPGEAKKWQKTQDGAWADYVGGSGSGSAQDAAQSAQDAAQSAQDAAQSAQEAAQHTTEHISDWLDNHPEATTTVQDGSITREKLDADLQQKTDEVSELKSAVITGEPETVTPTSVSNVNLAADGVKYTAANAYTTQYIAVQKGHKCIIAITAARSGEFRFGFSSEIPGTNVPATYLGKFTTSTSDSYTYTPAADGYFSVSNYYDLVSTITVTKYGDNLVDTVDGLLDSVGDISDIVNGTETTLTPVSVSNLDFKTTSTYFENRSNYTTQYVPVASGEAYKFVIESAENSAAYRFTLSPDIPQAGVKPTYIEEVSSSAGSKTHTITAAGDGYLCMSYLTAKLTSVTITAIIGMQDEINALNTGLGNTGDVLETVAEQVESLTDLNRPDDVIRLSNFTQGSIYNGSLDVSNAKCISGMDMYPLRRSILQSVSIAQANTDGTTWRMRFSFYDSTKTYISQDGYTERNGDITSLIPATAEYMRISISLYDDGTNQNITPEDYTSARYVTLTMTYTQKYVPYSKIETIPYGLTKYPYYGETINLPVHSVAYSQHMRVTGISNIQGSAVYGDYLFTANNGMSTITIFNMKTKASVASISMTATANYHCNNINFGAEKYDADDPFPLLYLSQENAAEHKAVVLRITLENGVYGATPVQTITYPDNDAAGMYYQNAYIDKENGFIYVCGFNSNTYIAGDGIKIIYKKYALPSLSDGDTQLEASDVLDTFEIDALSATQGGFIIGGRLYQCFGGPSFGDHSLNMCVIDLSVGAIVTRIIMSNNGFTVEPEAAVNWDGGLYCVDVNGYVTRLYTE